MRSSNAAPRQQSCDSSGRCYEPFPQNVAMALWRATSLLDRTPARIGIELSRCGCRFCRGLSQILLEQHAILIDDEGHDSRVSVFGGISDEGKSTGHFPCDQVLLRTTSRLIALSLQHVEVVAVERSVRVVLFAIPFRGC